MQQVVFYFETLWIRLWSIAFRFLAWTQGLKYRGQFDGTSEVVKFATALEKVCVATVESGKMTKDLAILISAGQPYLTTEEFLAALDTNLKTEMAKW